MGESGEIEVFDVSHSVREPFRQEGYVVLKRLFSGEEVRSLKLEMAGALERRKHESRLGGVILGMAAESPAVRQAVAHPRLAGALKDMFEEDAVFLSDKLVYKNTEAGFGSPWHQDHAYWRGSRKISAWIALDDATPDNGCLRFVPGSHRAGFVSHAGDISDAADIGFVSRLNDDAIDPSRIRDMPAERGDTIVFSDLLFHASYPNRSGKDRWALISTYKGASQEDPPYAWAKGAFKLTSN